MNTTTSSGNHYDPASYYERLSSEFLKFHSQPANVLAHLLTTPLGMIGAFCLLRNYTKSSSLAMTVTALYLISLLPVLPSGEFLGTLVLCGVILFASRTIKLNFWSAFGLIVAGYVLQDAAHYLTGEKTFQSSYSAGGHVDVANPVFWLQAFLEHCYYLLPLVVHVSFPLLKISPEIKLLLEAPLPSSMQQLQAFAWVLGPLVCFTLGSYCIDSKNSMCIFPGTPYFYRVLRCSLTKSNGHAGEDSIEKESKQKDLRVIRDWTMSEGPAENTSSHWWYHSLPAEPKAAFDRIANSIQIQRMFRSLFGESHYCMDVIPGMNEIYVSGPERADEAMNSDHVFFSRHVDGPWGFVPFVSVYRCIVGMDRNLMVSDLALLLPFLSHLTTAPSSSRLISLSRASAAMPLREMSWPSTSTEKCITSLETSPRKRRPTGSA